MWSVAVISHTLFRHVYIADRKLTGVVETVNYGNVV